MRRSEREITDKDEIFEILSNSQVLRVSFFDDGYPYIVPLSFGVKKEKGIFTAFFHCAAEGKKSELIKRNNHVCVEADVFDGYYGEGLNITTLYKSVIGFGKAEKCEGEEKIEGLRVLMEHCGFQTKRELLENCASLEKTAVYKITLESVTGKKNTK